MMMKKMLSKLVKIVVENVVAVAVMLLNDQL